MLEGDSWLQMGVDKSSLVIACHPLILSLEWQWKRSEKKSGVWAEMKNGLILQWFFNRIPSMLILHTHKYKIVGILPFSSSCFCFPA